MLYYENDTKFYGKEYSLEELEQEILKDNKFYENGGGVTFSGGEALLYFKDLEPLLKKLKEYGINICVETALVVEEEMVKIALKYVDEFIVDIKILDKTNAKSINSNTKLYENNVKLLYENKIKPLFRLPLVKEYTYTKQNIDIIIDFFKKYKFDNIQIFNIHNLGEKKYKTLNMKEFKIIKIDDTEIQDLIEKFRMNNINAELIKI